MKAARSPGHARCPWRQGGGRGQPAILASVPQLDGVLLSLSAATGQRAERAATRAGTRSRSRERTPGVSTLAQFPRPTLALFPTGLLGSGFYSMAPPVCQARPEQVLQLCGESVGGRPPEVLCYDDGAQSATAGGPSTRTAPAGRRCSRRGGRPRRRWQDGRAWTALGEQ